MATHILRAGTLVVLSGLPGSGKSTLMRTAQLPEGAVVSMDALREQLLGTLPVLRADGSKVLDRYQEANDVIYEMAQMMVKARLKEGLLTVVDATNLTDSDRSRWVALAEEMGAPAEVLILNTSLEQCLTNNAQRPFPVPEHVIREMNEPPLPEIAEHVKAKAGPNAKLSVTAPQGFMRTSKYPHTLVELGDTLEARPQELEDIHYDVIGDVHGLYDELLALLDKAGWRLNAQGKLRHGNSNRRLLFLGDLVDRGLKSLEVVRLVKAAVEDGFAKALLGNHEEKLVKFVEMAMRSGIESWSSYANAETGMTFLKLPTEERDALLAFLKRLPRCLVLEKHRIAFVHADVHYLDPLRTLSSRMLHGESGFKAIDSDAAYERRYAAGINQYTLFRGHIPQTSAQPHCFSLERQPFQKGELVLLKLDMFLARVDGGESRLKAFERSLVTHQCDFDFEQYSRKFALLKGLEKLAAEKHVTKQLDDTKMLRVYKYSKQTFYNNSWGVSPLMAKARGLVLDAGGNIVSHPFDKVFNLHENGTGDDLPDDLPVVVPEKLNGFLGIISRHPLKRGELLIHTQGGFGGDFVGYIAEYANEPQTRGAISRFLSKNDVTLMFEVLHPKDPHIIEYPPEMMGLHLLGIRGKGERDLPWTEAAVDAAAAEMAVIKRPSWSRMTFGELKQRLKTTKTEGWMVRADDAEQRHLLKAKSPFYLTSKLLGRLNRGRIMHMFANPADFKKTVDEEFYAVVDTIVSSLDKDTLAAMSHTDRVPVVRALIEQLL